MRPWLFFAASLANLAAATRTPFTSVTLGDPAPNILPNAYIVELDKAISAPGSRRELVTPHQQLYRQLQERGVPYQVFAWRTLHLHLLHPWLLVGSEGI